MSEAKPVAEAPLDLGVPEHEGDPNKPLELAVVLRDLRRALLQNDAIAVAVKELRGKVSSRDVVVSLSCLLAGVVGQAYAVVAQPIMVPLCIALIVIGYSGLFSLSHEAWHRRSHANRRLDSFLSRWVISGILIGDNEVHARDHKLHHRYPGEAQDPNSVTWKLPPAEFGRALFARLLIPGGYFNYHALHHLFPEILQRGLPKLYRVIEDTVDMSSEYYGVSEQVGLKTSYLSSGIVEPSVALAR